MNSRLLGRAPLVEMLFPGLKPGERAIRLAGGEVWAFPDYAPAEFENVFDVPLDLLPAFCEIVQNWDIGTLEAQYAAAGGAHLSGLRTGEMALTILGVGDDSASVGLAEPEFDPPDATEAETLFQQGKLFE